MDREMNCAASEPKRYLVLSYDPDFGFGEVMETDDKYTAVQNMLNEVLRERQDGSCIYDTVLKSAKSVLGYFPELYRRILDFPEGYGVCTITER